MKTIIYIFILSTMIVECAGKAVKENKNTAALDTIVLRNAESALISSYGLGTNNQEGSDTKALYIRKRGSVASHPAPATSFELRLRLDFGKMGERQLESFEEKEGDRLFRSGDNPYSHSLLSLFQLSHRILPHYQREIPHHQIYV